MNDQPTSNRFQTGSETHPETGPENGLGTGPENGLRGRSRTGRQSRSPGRGRGRGLARGLAHVGSRLRRATPLTARLPHHGRGQEPGGAWRRLTVSTTAGGMMLVGTPVMLDYVVRPGDTLSEIAEEHGTQVTRLVQRNGLHASGDQVYAGQTLDIPGAGGGESGTAGRISPDARRIVSYTVKPGDTPSGLAVRFHAWTAELIERNGSVLRVGERIEIPVVLAALAKDRRSPASRPSSGTDRPRPRQERDRPSRPHQSRDRQHSTGTRQPGDPSRAQVRRVIAGTARAHGVDPDLALAVSWQEAGWQMHHVSSADAVGAMQVIPSTGEWMSDVVGRDLRLHNLHDNVTAGVVLLKVLLQQAPERKAIAGYYQGLQGVRQFGMYGDTKRYVANVLALRALFERGRYPA